MADIAVLDRRIYVMGDVDRYLGLRTGTARRWIDGYHRQGTEYPPVIRPERTVDETVTWGEFVEAQLLSQFRDAGVPLQRLRPAVVRLRDEMQSEYPLAAARTLLDVHGRERAARRHFKRPAIPARQAVAASHPPLRKGPASRP